MELRVLFSIAILHVACFSSGGEPPSAEVMKLAKDFGQVEYSSKVATQDIFLGEIDSGSSFVGKFLLVNKTLEVSEIRKVISGCGCLTAYPAESKISPDKGVWIYFVIRSQSSGDQSKYIRILGADSSVICEVVAKFHSIPPLDLGVLSAAADSPGFLFCRAKLRNDLDSKELQIQVEGKLLESASFDYGSGNEVVGLKMALRSREWDAHETERSSFLRVMRGNVCISESPIVVKNPNALSVLPRSIDVSSVQDEVKLRCFIRSGNAKIRSAILDGTLTPAIRSASNNAVASMCGKETSSQGSELLKCEYVFQRIEDRSFDENSKIVWFYNDGQCEPLISVSITVLGN